MPVGYNRAMMFCPRPSPRTRRTALILRRVPGVCSAAALAAVLAAAPLAAKGPGDHGPGDHGPGNGAQGQGQDKGRDKGQGQGPGDHGPGDHGSGDSGQGKGQGPSGTDDGPSQPSQDGPRGSGGQDDTPGPGTPGPDTPEASPGDMPVISSGDSDVADLVYEGPSEPAASGQAWQPTDSRAMSFAPPGTPPAPAIETPAPAPTSTAAARPSAPAPATATSPVVVELFTSQGCSSCPPADALLGELTSRPDVLPLAFHVDYWDYLGWADPFARPEFTARQQAYGRRTGERAIYTPQIVVGGLDTPLDLGPASLEVLIDTHHDEGSPVQLAVASEDGKIRIDLAPGAAMTGASGVDLVRYVPRREVEIEAGENRGRTVVYRNVVVSIERLAVWDGRVPLRLTVVPRGGDKQALPADTRHAVLVQQIAKRRSLGQILAAVPID